jgi:phytol kinase
MLKDVLGAAVLMGYYLVFLLALPTALKLWGGVQKEWVRKIQHVAYSLSVFLLLEMFSAWYMAIAAAFLLVILAYPVLILAEKSGWYKKTFVDREAKGGELRKQLILVQLSFAVLIFVYWGLLGSSWYYIVAVSIMAWGFGDAAAALVGKAIGRRRVIHALLDGRKTYEGTGAMVLFAGGAIFFTLLLYAGKPWYISLAIAVIVAPVCAVVELFSKRGIDTLTVPFSVALLTMPLLYLFTSLGW